MPRFPGYLRQAFLDWIAEGLPPLASVEVDHTPETWPAERLLRLMLTCSEIMPGNVYRATVERYGLERSRRQTYASIARVLLDEWRKTVTDET